jgi:hypothetical protein
MTTSELVGLGILRRRPNLKGGAVRARVTLCCDALKLFLHFRDFGAGGPTAGIVRSPPVEAGGAACGAHLGVPFGGSDYTQRRGRRARLRASLSPGRAGRGGVSAVLNPVGSGRRPLGSPGRGAKGAGGREDPRGCRGEHKGPERFPLLVASFRPPAPRAGQRWRPPPRLPSGG